MDFIARLVGRCFIYMVSSPLGLLPCHSGEACVSVNLINLLMITSVWENVPEGKGLDKKFSITI